MMGSLQRFTTMNTSAACSVVRDFNRNGWQDQDRSREWCVELESGRILLFDGIPFDLPAEDRDFLLSQRQTESRFHKNISYRPTSDVLRGIANDAPDRGRMQSVMRGYSQQVVGFVKKFLAPYGHDFQLDYASFRPLEEKNRDLALHKRNDLLHVDAFPTRPTRGARILRVFTNINPSVDRVWTHRRTLPRPRHEAGHSRRRAALRPTFLGRPLCSRRTECRARHRRSRPQPLPIRPLHAAFPRLAEGEQRFPIGIPQNSNRFLAGLHLDGLYRRRPARRPLRPVCPRANVHHPTTRPRRPRTFPLASPGRNRRRTDVVLIRQPTAPRHSPHRSSLLHPSLLSSRGAQRRKDLLFLPRPAHIVPRSSIPLSCPPEERSDVRTCCSTPASLTQPNHRCYDDYVGCTPSMQASPSSSPA